MQNAMSRRGNEQQIITPPPAAFIEDDISKKFLKLDLKHGLEKGTSGEEDEKTVRMELKSPQSPVSNSSRAGIRHSTMSHQGSITSQIDVIEDRKALRDALYQGIFHRHRRTIFAVGSFLRMLRTRNAQYNTIRSSSEGEDDTR